MKYAITYDPNPKHDDTKIIRIQLCIFYVKIYYLIDLMYLEVMVLMNY